MYRWESGSKERLSRPYWAARSVRDVARRRRRSDDKVSQHLENSRAKLGCQTPIEACLLLLVADVREHRGVGN